LILTLLLPVPINADRDIGEFLGINSVVEALSPEKRRERSVQEKRKTKYHLSPDKVRANNINAYNDLIDIVNLYFLSDLGCVHCRMVWFLAFGKLEHYPRCMLPCETQCFVCTGEHQKYILPIVYEGAIEFLKSRQLVDAMPYKICYSDIEGLVDLLYKDSDWTERVFAIKTVSKYNVAAFFFQLIVTKILSFEWVGTTKLVCVISRVGTSTVFNYENITCWEGFEF